MKNNAGEFNFLTILLMTLGVVFVVLLMRTGMFIFGALMLVATVIVSTFYVINKIVKARQEKQYAKTIEGNVDRKINDCIRQIDRNNAEIKEINQNINDLEKQLNPSLQLAEKTAAERQRILDAFKKELKLRTAKIDFYEICLNKLQTLQYNHQIARDLAKRKEKLSRLQEEHYEDLASMESMKHEVEDDRFYLENIETLQNRMLESNSIDSAEELRLELVEITKELRKV